jgi:hypothetical protein
MALERNATCMQSHLLKLLHGSRLKGAGVHEDGITKQQTQFNVGFQTLKSFGISLTVNRNVTSSFSVYFDIEPINSIVVLQLEGRLSAADAAETQIDDVDA